MSQSRIIKRYANRKLYDTQHSRYVTLDQISEMIREGDDVKIIDNKSKEDLTSVTLAQIIFEEEKKQRSFLPLQAMRNIIQNGGESLGQLFSEAQRRVTSMLPRKKDEGEDEGEGEALEGEGEGDGAVSESVRDSDSELTSTVPQTRRSEALASLRELREWVQQSQRTIDEWQRRVDERIRHAIEGISPFSGLHKDVKALGSRIADLEAKLTGMVEASTTAVASTPSESETRPGEAGTNGSEPAPADPH